MDQLTALCSSPVGWFLLIAAGAAIGTIGFQKKRELVAHRKVAQEIAARFRRMGFERIPRCFEDIAVGDYVDLVRSLKEISQLLSDEDQCRTEMQKCLRLLLTDLLRDPDRRPATLKLIEDVKAATAPRV